MLHTVYIYRGSDSTGYVAYNVGPDDYDDIYEVIHSDESSAKDMFISGVIIDD